MYAHTSVLIHFHKVLMYVSTYLHFDMPPVLQISSPNLETFLPSHRLILPSWRLLIVAFALSSTNQAYGPHTRIHSFEDKLFLCMPFVNIYIPLFHIFLVFYFRIQVRISVKFIRNHMV